MMTRPPVPIIEGGRTHVRLRPQRDGDRDERLSIGRDAEFVRLNGREPAHSGPLTARDAQRWHASFPESLRWMIERDGRLIGEARLDGVDATAHAAQFAIGIFAPGDRDRGIGTEVTRLVLHYAFERLGLARVDLRVLAMNSRAIHCYEQCGFTTYTREHDRSFIGGRWQDDLLMRVTAETYLAEHAKWGLG